jgi:hypothetical protein
MNPLVAPGTRIYYRAFKNFSHSHIWAKGFALLDSKSLKHAHRHLVPVPDGFDVYQIRNVAIKTRVIVRERIPSL